MGKKNLTCQVGKMSGWQNVWSGKIYGWQKVGVAQCLVLNGVAKCLGGTMSSGKMYGWQNVWLLKCMGVKNSGCQNVGCQILWCHNVE